MSKVFKNIMLIILLVACLFNVITKLVARKSVREELLSSAAYMEEKQSETQSQE